MDLELLKDLPPWEWPEDAAPMVLAVLTDDKATDLDRQTAAELAGDITVINEAMVDALLSLLRRTDVSVALRAAAALSLGPCLEEGDTMGFDEEDEPCLPEATHGRLIEELHQLYLDEAMPGEVRRALLEASARAPQPWHTEAVRAAWDRSELEWRTSAVFCMDYVEGFHVEILEALQGDDPVLLYNAVCAAGSWELDEAWDRVAQLAVDTSGDIELRLAAITATAVIRPDDAEEALGELTEEKDEEIVQAAHEAIALAHELDLLDENEEDDEDDEDDEDLGEDEEPAPGN